MIDALRIRAATAADVPAIANIVDQAYRHYIVDQHVEDLALVVDGTPQVHPLAGDPNNHLVQVPPIARAGTVPP